VSDDQENDGLEEGDYNGDGTIRRVYVCDRFGKVR
jgi:hypothetical protein